LLITQRLSVPVARCGKTDPIQIEDQPKHKTIDFSISIRKISQAANPNEFFAQKATELVRNRSVLQFVVLRSERSEQYYRPTEQVKPMSEVFELFPFFW